MPCPTNPDFEALGDYLLRITSPSMKGYPTVFMPVSPLPYMNGAPKKFLSWVIECRDVEFSPARCCEWLEGRLPEPVDDREQWKAEEDQE